MGFHPLPEMGEHLIKHGDAVKDIAFKVEDCDFLVKVNPILIPEVELQSILVFFINGTHFKTHFRFTKLQ